MRDLSIVCQCSRRMCMSCVRKYSKGRKVQRCLCQGWFVVRRVMMDVRKVSVGFALQETRYQNNQSTHATFSCLERLNLQELFSELLQGTSWPMGLLADTLKFWWAAHFKLRHPLAGDSSPAQVSNKPLQGQHAIDMRRKSSSNHCKTSPVFWTSWPQHRCLTAEASKHVHKKPPDACYRVKIADVQ